MQHICQEICPCWLKKWLMNLLVYTFHLHLADPRRRALPLLHMLFSLLQAVTCRMSPGYVSAEQIQPAHPWHHPNSSQRSGTPKGWPASLLRWNSNSYSNSGAKKQLPLQQHMPWPMTTLRNSQRLASKPAQVKQQQLQQQWRQETTTIRAAHVRTNITVPLYNPTDINSIQTISNLSVAWTTQLNNTMFVNPRGTNNSTERWYLSSEQITQQRDDICQVNK